MLVGAFGVLLVVTQEPAALSPNRHGQFVMHNSEARPGSGHQVLQDLLASGDFLRGDFFL